MLHYTRLAFPLMGAAYLFIAAFYISTGLLQAQARPGIIVVGYLVGAWLVCVPLAYLLAFPLGVGLPGVLYALILGYAVVTAFTVYGAARTDWDAVIEDARRRNEKAGTVPTPRSDRDHSRSATPAGADDVDAPRPKARKSAGEAHLALLDPSASTSTGSAVSGTGNGGGGSDGAGPRDDGDDEGSEVAVLDEHHLAA